MIRPFRLEYSAFDISLLNKSGSDCITSLVPRVVTFSVHVVLCCATQFVGWSGKGFHFAHVVSCAAMIVDSRWDVRTVVGCSVGTVVVACAVYMSRCMCSVAHVSAVVARCMCSYTTTL